MNFKYFVITILALTSQMHAMKQGLPNKRQKVEEPVQPTGRKPLSLRNACLKYISRNNAQHPCVQNDTMAILANPRIADQTLKQELIEQLKSEFIDTYETNIIELIKDNQLSEQNQALLISKLPSQVIDEQLSDLIFDGKRSASIRSLLINMVSPEFIQKNSDTLSALFLDENTSHEIACTLVSTTPSLHTLNAICSVSEEGAITSEIAHIAARLFDLKHWGLFTKNYLYQDNMLAHGNKEIFRQAHSDLLLEEMNDFIITEVLKDSSPEQRAHIKLYGSDKESFCILLNSAAACIKKDGQKICTYNVSNTLTDEIKLNDGEKIAALSPCGQYAAVLYVHQDLQSCFIDIVDISHNKRIISLTVQNNNWSKLAWTSDGRKLILINNDGTCMTTGINYRLINKVLNLEEILQIRISLKIYSMASTDIVIDLKELKQSTQASLQTLATNDVNPLIDQIHGLANSVSQDTYKEIKNFLEKFYNAPLDKVKAIVMHESSKKIVEAIHELIEKIEQFAKEDQQ